MMDRKSPYRHPVKSHIRDGKRIERYIRGSGDKPRVSSKRGNVGHGAGYSVVWLYPDGTREGGRVRSGSPVEAAGAAVGLLSRGVPVKLTIRRGN